VLRRPLAVLLVALTGILGAGAGAARAATLRFGPSAHRDARDVAGSPLDVTGATFGQREARLTLRLQTRSSWTASDLDAAAGRALCVELYVGARRLPRANICVTARSGTAALGYLHLNDAGQIDEQREVPASVSRPNRRELDATFTRVEAGLPRGRFRWRVISRWTDAAACAPPAACVDLAPNKGLFTETIGFVAGPACFGAAARNPGSHCSNPALRNAVIPTPREATRTPNAYCASGPRVGMVSACSFGVSEALASTTMAIVGDSHAQHWRGALEVVAEEKRWHGLSITRAGCPLTNATPILPGKQATRDCHRWLLEVQAWFQHHPEVSTIVVAAHAGAHTTGGTREGYRAAWNALPSSVRHIIVLHDTPTIGNQSGCIRRAMAAHKRAGLACAVKRSRGLRPDEHYAAALSSGSKRVSTIDMSRFFCSSSLCFPVVGGALVHKEGEHMTRLFAGTLGRFLLERINRVT
jgi:SGNH domain (fused to AT3 domains)